MRVSKLWLNEWVEVENLTGQELSETLTMAGLEVDEIVPAAAPFSKVVVGEVLTVEPHSDAKKLVVCQIEVGQATPLNIVCGASNVVEGAKVAVALIGAELPNGLSIKETTLRGVLSEGMLLSEEELGFEKSQEGIWLLASNAPVGESLREYLSLEDEIIDIDLTPNRGDCLSLHGIAREVAALLQRPLKKEVLDTEILEKSSRELPVEIEAKEFCPRYLGRVIEGLPLGVETPVWMKERLRRAGLRSLSFVVDVTNYVMLELGQPMHAFDLETLDGQIVVRSAKVGEKLMLLNDKEVRLRDNTVVIADKTQALAIAGVMGGLESAVSDKTTNLFLESAYFAKENIAGTAREYGLATDSSHRFERGVAPELQRPAIELATKLICEIAGGKAGEIIEQTIEENLPHSKIIQFNPQNSHRLLGHRLDEAQMNEIFERLGFKVQSTGEVWDVWVPSFRFDVDIEADLIEEIARVYGYNKLPEAPIQAKFYANAKSETHISRATLANVLTQRGYSEVISYSFVDPKLQALIYGNSDGLSLLNPISPELSQMRKGLWPGLIDRAMFNLHRQETSFKLFESGLVFSKDGEKLDQIPMIAGLMVGDEDGGWHGLRAYDFYDLKGDLEALMEPHGLSNYQFNEGRHPALHPGQSSELYYNGESVGHLGVLHPSLLSALDCEQKIFVFEVELKALSQVHLPNFKKISKFPLIRRDLSFIVDKSTNFSDITRAVHDLSKESSFFQECKVFDVYLGKGIPEGKKSVAIGLILQHPKRTLVDDEVNQYIDAILIKLKNDFNITLRE